MGLLNKKVNSQFYILNSQLSFLPGNLGKANIIDYITGNAEFEEIINVVSKNLRSFTLT